MKKFFLRTEPARAHCLAFINGIKLDNGHPVVVEIKPFVNRRSLAQNDFFHAVTLRLICDTTGYSIEDMKEYLLGEAFGWEQVVFDGRTLERPVKRGTSKLNVKEFSWFIEWCGSWAADTLGVIVPLPGEDVTGHHS